MSELKVDKITPRLGTTLTLGDSGDTINFGSGVLPNFENLTVTGDLTVDTNSLKVDSTNNFVGIGTASPSVALDVVGAITATGNITGTLATAAQPNITSVGTLTSATISGDLTIGTNHTIGDDANLNLELTSATNEDIVLASARNVQADLDHNSAGGTRTFSVTSQGLTKTHLLVNTGGDISFYEDTGTTAKLFWDASTERLGIGNSSPLNTLHVDSSDSTIARFVSSTTSGILQVGNNQSGTGTTPELRFHHNDVLGSRIISESTEDFVSAGNRSAKMRFSAASNGNNYDMVTMIPGISASLVGINTTSPQKALHVVGPDGSAGVTEGNSNTALYVDNNDSCIINIQSGTGTTDYGSIFFSDAEAQNRGAIYYNHPDDSFRFNTAATERMRIDSSGNVGIGTSSPANTLHVYGDNCQIKIEQPNSTNSTRLQVKNTTSDLYFGLDSSSGGSFGIANAGVIWLNSNNPLVFATNNSQRMRIDSSGNVGIGTSSPATKLDIAGNLRFSSANPVIELNNGGPQIYTTVANTLMFATGGGIGSPLERMRIDSSGNVLVGATSTTGIANGSTVNEGSAIVQSGGLQAQRNNDSPLYLSKASGYTYDGFARFFHNGTEVGKIGFHDNDLVIGTGDTGLKFNDAANAWVPWNTSTNSAVNGTINIGGSTVGIKDIYTTGSIYLGGTGSANALDDYEEGTFTPTLEGSTGNPTATYGVQYGRYTKIGDTVTFQCCLKLNSLSGGSGEVLIATLPFTPADIGGFKHPTFATFIVNTPVTDIYKALVFSSGKIFFRNANTTGDNSMAFSTIDGDTGFFVTGNYKTNA